MGPDGMMGMAGMMGGTAASLDASMTGSMPGGLTASSSPMRKSRGAQDNQAFEEYVRVLCRAKPAEDCSIALFVVYVIILFCFCVWV